MIADVDTDAFAAARPRLFGIAYRMLGSVAEAEDIVGDVAERWLATDRDVIREPEAWLVTVTTRRALDVARSARLQRVDYPGEWLPEPVDTGDPTIIDVERRETLTMGFLLLLERLTPVERAVFVLHDVLEMAYPRVAEAIGRSEAACRQALHRARPHVAVPERATDADRARARAVASRFMAVTLGGDVDELIAMLSPEVFATSDGGGVVHAAMRTVREPARVARFLVNLAARSGPAGFVHVCELNGEPGIVMHTQVGWIALVASSDGAVVTGVNFVVAPAKLERLVERLGAGHAGGDDRPGVWDISRNQFRHRGGRPVDA